MRYASVENRLGRALVQWISITFLDHQLPIFSKSVSSPVLPSILQQQDQPYNQVTSVDRFVVGNLPDMEH